MSALKNNVRNSLDCRFEDVFVCNESTLPLVTHKGSLLVMLQLPTVGTLLTCSVIYQGLKPKCGE